MAPQPDNTVPEGRVTVPPFAELNDCQIEVLAEGRARLRWRRARLAEFGCVPEDWSTWPADPADVAVGA
jgi:hypothetical protein